MMLAFWHVEQMHALLNGKSVTFQDVEVDNIESEVEIEEHIDEKEQQ